MQFIVENDAPLIDILVRISPSSSKTTLRSWLKDGRVTVDGLVVKRADAVTEPGQKVAVGAKSQYVAEKIRIVYEDQHLIAVEKPTGLLSVATAFEKGDTVHALLKKHFHPRKVYVVHRLDQDTSGVMLFALSEQGYNGLKALFAKHEIDRCYCALVEGVLNPPSGTWESYVYEDANYVVHSTTNPEQGSIAITHYKVVNSSPRHSRLELKLETGRKNQIRVHCSDKGHPVVGDKKYGAVSDPLHRLCLHAQSIGFIHPTTKMKMSFESSVPPAFDRLVKDKHA